MDKKRRIFVGVGILSLCLVVAGVLYAGYRQDTKRIKIIYVAKNNEESDFWAAAVAGAKMAAKEFEAELSVLSTKKELDLEIQNDLIDQAIAENPDVILLTPADYTATLPKAKKIKEKGIKLVLIDSILEEAIADSVVSTDNLYAGEGLGAYAKSLMQEDTKIGIVSHVKGSSTAIEREEGVRKGLGDEQDKIVEVVYSDSQYEKAYQVTKKLLLKYPDMNLLIALNEYSTVGAGRAVKDMGLDKQVNIIGFDNSIEEIRFLESGIVEGIVIQRPFEMGYLGVEAGVELVKGRKVEKEIDSGAKLIVKDEIYTPENQKLLFPFWGEQGK